METAIVGEAFSGTGGLVFSDVKEGSIKQGPTLAAQSSTLGLTATVGSLIYDSDIGEAQYYVTISGTPTAAGKATFVYYIVCDAFSNGEEDITPSSSFTVTVLEAGSTVLVTNIYFNSGTSTVTVGSSISRGVGFMPTDAADQTATFTIDSGEEYITLSSTATTCFVTGVSPGTAVIRATANDGGGATNTWTVTVVAASSGGSTKTTITTFYDPNGGRCYVLSGVHTIGQTFRGLPDESQVSRANETRDGKIYMYTFAGWWTAATGGSQILPTDKVTQTSDFTLYAHWTEEEFIVPSEGTGANDTPQAGMSESILISDNTGDTFYTLLGRVEADGEPYFYNCISSLSITGGPEDPFEYLTIVVPKKRLEYVASELVEANGILPGVTKVQLDCMGRGTFTVTKCRYSGRRYTITAYCDAERFRGATNDRLLTGDPWTIIMEILGMRSSYGISISYLDTEDLYDPSVAARCTESLSFEADTNLWYILQVCAMLCRCRIWFSDDTVHIRDCTTAYTNRTHPGTEAVDLYPEDEDDAMYARVVDEVDLGDEGSDTVVNSVTIRCAYEEGGTMANIGPLYGDGTTSKPSDGSVRKFGERAEALSIPELVWRYDTEEGETATADTDKVSDLCALFAQSYIAYLSEPQQSVEFTVKEMQLNEKGDGYEWLSYFDDPSMASEIVDVPDEVHLTNESVCGQGTLPQKLMLSTRTRHYPNRTTTYTFGQMKSISLSDSTSRIMDALNKG